MFVTRHIATIEELLSLPAPHSVDLRVSDEFWDSDIAVRREASEDFATHCESLVTLLSQRLGEARTLDLTDHLVRVVDGEPVPEPLHTLCGYVGVLHWWQVGERWLGVGVGQQGSTLPLRLVAAVGEG